jgi:hypothetical protein
MTAALVATPRRGAASVAPHRVGPAPLVAVGLLVLALGLPWLQTIGTSGTYLPGYITPGFCTTTYGYDGYATSECSPMTVGVGMSLPGSAGSITSGASHPARFGIVWAMVATVVAIRRRAPRFFLVGAAGLGVVMAISAGLGFSTSGVCAAWLAVGLLTFSGLSRDPTRRRYSR